MGMFGNDRIDMMKLPLGFTICYETAEDALEAAFTGNERAKFETMTVDKSVRYALQNAKVETQREKMMRKNIERLLEVGNYFYVVFDRTLSRSLSKDGSVAADTRNDRICDPAYLRELPDVNDDKYLGCNVRVKKEGSIEILA